MKTYINKRGFTLVELLVAISILGIIMIIALPQLSGLQSDNKNTKYEKYSDSVVTSAKLYTDSYAKDMFGNNASGCYDIPYKKLEEKNLAKDIRVDDLTCDTYNGANPTTFVRVYKSQDVYLYDIAIKCVDKNNKVVYEKTLNGDICNGKRADETGPEISISDVNTDWTTGRDASGNPLKVAVTVEDPFGLKENIQFLYAWTKDTSNLDSLSYKTHSFTNSREEAIRTLTKYIEYPQNENGIWYLVIKPGPDGIRDLNGNYYLDSHVISQTVKLDNTPPVLANLANSKDGVWTNQSVTISGAISDSHSGVKKIYYSYKSDGTSPTAFGTSQITSGGNGPFNVSNTWTTDTNQSIYLIGEDAVGNKTAVIAAGKVMLDKTEPQIEWLLAPGVHDNNAGISVTSKCTDALSGVKTSSSATSIASPTSSSGQNVTHTCTDNAGNTASKTGNYKVRIYNRHSSCGIESYNSCENSACGISKYKSCRTSACGVESYKTCSNSACGYATCKSSSCGYATCTSSSCGVNQYKSCKHANCGYNQVSKQVRVRCEYVCKNGTYTRDGWGEVDVCDGNITGVSCPYTNGSCSSNGDVTGPTRMAQCLEYVPATCRNSACGVESYKSCATSACGYATCKSSSCGYASCTTSACGVNQYKSCVDASCGVESYKTCATEECGVKSYKECWHY